MDGDSSSGILVKAAMAGVFFRIIWAKEGDFFSFLFDRVRS